MTLVEAMVAVWDAHNEPVPFAEPFVEFLPRQCAEATIQLHERHGDWCNAELFALEWALEESA